MPMIRTQEPSTVMTLQQAAAYLRISKAHLSNVIGGKVPGVPAHALGPHRSPHPDPPGVDGSVAGERRRGGRPLKVKSRSCQESAPLTQERENRMRRKRYQKGSLQVRKHGRASRVGLPFGGRTTAAGEVLGSARR